jgi:hypothetical protein
VGHALVSFGEYDEVLPCGRFLSHNVVLSDWLPGDNDGSESAPPGYRYSQFWSFYFYLFDRRHQYGGTAKNLRFDWRSYRDAKFSFLKDAIEESMELGLIDYKKQREPLFLDPDLLRPPRYFPDNWMLGTEKVLHQSHPPDDVPR